MEVIQSLQGNRPVIVRVFDEFVRILPEGVYFEKLKMTGNDIDIEGVSESNNRISRLMRNMDDSEWFDAPNLDGRQGESRENRAVLSKWCSAGCPKMTLGGGTQVSDIQESLDKLRNMDLADLDFDNMGSWPAPFKAIVCVAVFGFCALYGVPVAS